MQESFDYRPPIREGMDIIEVSLRSLVEPMLLAKYPDGIPRRFFNNRGTLLECSKLLYFLWDLRYEKPSRFKNILFFNYVFQVKSARNDMSHSGFESIEEAEHGLLAMILLLTCLDDLESANKIRTIRKRLNSPTRLSSDAPIDEHEPAKNKSTAQPPHTVLETSKQDSMSNLFQMAAKLSAKNVVKPSGTKQTNRRAKANDKELVQIPVDLNSRDLERLWNNRHRITATLIGQRIYDYVANRSDLGRPIISTHSYQDTFYLNIGSQAMAAKDKTGWTIYSPEFAKRHTDYPVAILTVNVSTDHSKVLTAMAHYFYLVRSRLFAEAHEQILEWMREQDPEANLPETEYVTETVSPYVSRFVQSNVIPLSYSVFGPNTNYGQSYTEEELKNPDLAIRLEQFLQASRLLSSPSIWQEVFNSVMRSPKATAD